MTVFNTFFKVIKKYKGTVILYTVMLIVFGTLNMTSNNETTTFIDTKPDVLIISNDDNIGLTKNLIDYITDNTNVVKIENDEDKINDALFYRDINYIIYIPKNYRIDTLNKKNVPIDIKTVKDYNSMIANTILSRYLKIQNIYNKLDLSEEELINTINTNLNSKTDIEITSKLDTRKTSNLDRYFNFASYSVMAVVLYIICLVMSSFKENTLNKRIIVSGMNYKKHNFLILLSSLVYSIVVWILYVILGIILLKVNIFDLRVAMYILNMLIFTFVSLTLSLFISNLLNNKNAINGIVNVVALGSSFLCGAFVPAMYLPSGVLAFSRILPSYWYVNSNDILSNIEYLNFNTLKVVFINMSVLIIFSIIFIILNNIVSKYKRTT